jgi:hypothetical protein
VKVVQDERCISLMTAFIAAHRVCGARILEGKRRGHTEREHVNHQVTSTNSRRGWAPAQLKKIFS